MVRLLRCLALGALTLVVGIVPALALATVQAPPAAAATARPRGIDVANYQHPGGQPINWAQVRASGIEFAFIKATEGPIGCTGNYYTNSWFKTDWDAAGANGIYRSAYHFAEPGDVNSAIIQARYFVNRVGPMNGPYDLPPVLDFEVTCGLSPAQLSAFAHAWLDEVERLTGRQSIITTYPSFWSGPMQGDRSFSNYPLWIATYGPAPIVPPAWPSWTFWQDSSTGTVPGVPARVDTDWFQFGTDGLARLANSMNHDPIGALDIVEGGTGSVRVAGWTLDLDGLAPIEAHVYVSGITAKAGMADVSRPDVGSLYQAWGSQHGFDITIGNIPGGVQTVCVFGISIGQGGNTLIQCRTVFVRPADPFGSFDAATPGFRSARLQGWTMDPDTPNPITIHAYVDGAFHSAHATGAARPDVATAFAAGGNHGFDTTVTGLSAGAHTICIYALNAAGYGVNPVIGCRAVTVPGGTPQGGITIGDAGAGSARYTGWVYDPDTTASTSVHVYVDGVFRQALDGNANLPGFDAGHPGYGNAHGIDGTITGLSPGRHSLCTFALNIAGPGVNPLIDCRSLTIGGPPIGVVDYVATGVGSLRVVGWDIDPDLAGPTRAHIYVDGVGYNVEANAPRADVGTIYRNYGNNHGIDTTITGLAPGPHSVCTFAIDLVAPGQHQLMDCRTVTVR